jgi:hypothetical protein
VGRMCLINNDCVTNMCTGGICQAGASCNDGIRNGQETDVDCGGPVCQPCADGRLCQLNRDCSSNMCSGGICAAAASCNDGIKNGQETDVDCGGPKCSPCLNGKMCIVNSDCLSNGCSLGICCAQGFGNCGGNGCVVNLNSDFLNCGQCGNSCANGQTCSNGLCVAGQQLYTFSGVKKSLPVGSLTGWTQCFSDTYSDTLSSVATILQNCNGARLLLACRPAGSNTLTLAAMANRADVTFDTGQANTNVSHTANGVSWYFNSSHSWGFVPQGYQINLNSCDTYGIVTNPDPNGDSTSRMCWHTSNGNIGSGYRCGATSLNGDGGWERLVYQAN